MTKCKACDKDITKGVKNVPTVVKTKKISL